MANESCELDLILTGSAGVWLGYVLLLVSDWLPYTACANQRQIMSLKDAETDIH